METPRFSFACSYQGTVWFDVLDSSGRWELEFRHRLDDCERATLNGGAAGAYAREVESLIGFLVPRWPRKEPLTLAFVRAFNAWQEQEAAAWVLRIESAPERYGELTEADRRPRHVAKGCAYWRMTTPPDPVTYGGCAGHWEFQTLPEADAKAAA